MTSTTVTTTTTLKPMGLGITPLRLLPCQPLSLILTPPPGHWVYEWHCLPRYSALCVKILALAEELGYTATELVIPYFDVAGAAVVTESDEDSYVTVQGVAYGIDGQVYARAENEFFFNFRGSTLLPVPGQRTYSVLDNYIRVAATMETCEGDAPLMKWAYHRVSSDKDWVPLYHLPFLPRLRLPISDLEGPGDYVLRGALVDDSTKVEVYFDVTVEPMPAPTIRLAAPAMASAACSILIDASGSEDLAGGSLHFQWSCSAHDSVSAEARAACEASASENAGASTLLLPGEALGSGVFNISVEVSVVDQPDRNSSSAWASVIVSPPESSPGAVVAMGPINEKVSDEQQLDFFATIAASDACRPGAWASWWLVNVSEDGDVLGNSSFISVSEAAETTTNLKLNLASYWSPGAGVYRLRLLLSPSAPAGSNYPESVGWSYDSAVFRVDVPPLGGACTIYPTVGNATETGFRLESISWEEEDLPLEHRFSWILRSFPTTTTPGDSRFYQASSSDDDAVLSEEDQAATEAWQLIRPWGQDSTFAGVVFGVAGVIAVKVEVRDSLGTTNTAEVEALIMRLSTPLTEERFIERLDSSIATGNPYAMLTTATALASSLPKFYSTRPSSTITRALLSTITGSGVFEDPTADLLEQAATTAAKTVAAACMPTTVNANVTSPIDYYVAVDVIQLLEKMSKAALLLTNGMPSSVSTLLAGIVPLLITATDQDPTLTDRGLQLTGALLSPEKEVILLKQLSEAMASSMEQVGDAIGKGLPLGGSSVIDNGLFFVLKESLETAASHGFIATGLSVTPSSGNNSTDDNSTSGSRRLWSVPMSCQELAQAELAAKDPDASLDTLKVDGDGESVATLQDLRWPSNVLGFLGTKGSAIEVNPPPMLGTHFVRPGVEMVASVKMECCDIVEDALVTLTVRSCGVPLDIGSAEVRFDIPVASRPSPAAQTAETRVCLRYDEPTLAWTGEGCQVSALTDDSVQCSCSQLGTFTAGWATFTSTFTEVVHCNAIDVASVKTWESNLPEGEWMVTAQGVTFFLLVAWLMLLFPLFSLCRTARRRHREKLSRHWFLCMFETDDEEEKELGFSRKRILLAAERHHRFKIFARAFWQVLYHHYYFVKIPAEELAMREPRECLDVARTVELLQETSTHNLGLTSSDTWYLRRCSKMQQPASKDHSDDLPAPKKDPDLGTSEFETESERVHRLLLSYRDIVVAARGEFLAASADERFHELRFWRLFRAFHPLRELLRPSLVERQTMRVAAFWMEVWFGIGLCSMLLASSSYLFDVTSATECGPRSAGAAFFEDLSCALLSVLVTKPLAGLLLYCHTRHSRKRVTRSLSIWLPSTSFRRQLEDVSLICLTTFVGLLGAGVTLGFVSVSNEDAGIHWIITLALYLLVIWFFIPYFMARSRRKVLRRVAKNEVAKSMLGEVLESLLTKEEHVDADRIYAYDDNGKPILRPAWLDDIKSGIFGQEKASETFDNWVGAEAKTGSLSRAPTIFLEAEAASLCNTLAIATAESPKPPAILPPPLDGNWTLSTLVPPAGPSPGSPPARSCESPAGRRNSGTSILSSVASVGRITLHTSSSMDDLSVSSFGESRPSPIFWDEDPSWDYKNNTSINSNSRDDASNAFFDNHNNNNNNNENPSPTNGIRVEVARSCFQQWAEEWSRMQHSELCERQVKLSRGTTCTLDQSPTHNKGFDKRVERAQLLKEGFKATIVDGREPVAFRNTVPASTPLWVNEWRPPSSALPASPMSSWAALSYRSSPSQSLQRSRTATSPLGSSSRSSPSHHRRKA